MNKHIKKIIMVCELLFLLTVFVGCKRVKYEEVNLYFPNVDNELIGTEIKVKANTKEETVEGIQKALIKGMAKENIINIYNDKIVFKEATYKSGLVTINLTGDYLGATTRDRLLVRAGIVKTYSDLAYVRSFKFLVDGKDAVDEYGQKLDVIAKDNMIILEKYEEKEVVDTTVLLYFTDRQRQKLVYEQRDVPNKSINQLAITVLKELIKGSEKYLTATVPKETKINGVEIKDGICYVDLNKEFITKHPGGSTSEELTIYSIVNTLTELPDIDRVQFLIDGEKCKEYKGNFEFNMPFTRNENIIRAEE